MVVASEKIGVNFTLPAPVRDAFEELTADYGGKQKWMLITAAIGLLAEKNEKQIRDLVAEVAGMDAGDRIGEWIQSRRPPMRAAARPRQKGE